MTRRKRLIEYNGETHHMKEWARITGISPSAIKYRLDHGWSIKDTLTIKVGSVNDRGVKDRNKYDTKWPRCPEAVLCFGCSAGRCSILSNTDFNGTCPFFKSPEDYEQGLKEHGGPLPPLKGNRR